MADKIVIEVDLETGDTRSTYNEIEKGATRAGDKAGKKFTKEFKSEVSTGLKSLGRTIAAVGAAAATIGSALIFKESIEAAAAQEDAVNRLNAALQISGDFSQQASQDFQEFASQLQQATRFGDEAILNQIALAKSFGATNEQAKEAAAAAADLSEAFGIDLESATRNAAKTLGGYAGELGEVIPELKELTKEQLQAGEGIRLISERFAGTAAARVKTFSGAVQQLSNSFGDLLEEVGFLITKNPSVIRGLNQLSGLFSSLGKSVSNFAGDFNVFNDAAIPLTNFAESIITFVISPLELLGNVLDIAQSNLNTWVSATVAAFGQVGGAAGQLISFFSPNSELAQGLKDFAETSAEVFKESAQDSIDAYKTVLDFPFSEGLKAKNEELRNVLVEQRDIIAEESAVTNETLTEQQLAAFQKQNELIEQQKKNVAEAAKTIANFSKQTAASLRTGFAQGAASAFAEFGRALQAGENALEAFGQQFLKAVGNVLVQQGTAFILEGTAYAFSGNPELQAKSAGLIGAGAAMATFGGVLGASVSGGGSSAASVGGVATTTATDDTLATAETADPELVQADERTGVNLVVQGSVFNTEETGRTLIGLLNNNFEREGGFFTGARNA